MPGPAPKHPSARARRNNAKADFRTLDPKSRRGKKAPAWPLRPDVRATAELRVARDRAEAAEAALEECTDGRKRGRLRRELDRARLTAATLEAEIEGEGELQAELWATLWAMPQATLWLESHAEREVAQYVLWKVRAEQGDLKASTEARQLGDRLGLTPLALLKLRAEVEHVEAAEAQNRQRRAGTSPAQPPTRRGKKPPEDPRQGLYAVS